MSRTTTTSHSGIHKLLHTLGLSRETLIGFALAIIGSFLITGVLLISKGSIAAAIAVILGIIWVVIAFYRIDFSFILLIGLVLFFDQFYIPGFRPPTFKVSFFDNLKQNPYLPHFNIAVFNMIELYLLLILFTIFIILVVKKRFEVRKINVWFPFVLFFGWFIFSFIRGLQQGGEFLKALWEVRALFYLGIFYILTSQIIQTKRQIRILIWVAIATITFKALQGIARYVAMGFSMQGYETLTNHEDPLFMSWLLFLMISFVIYKVKDRQKTAILLLTLPLLLGIYVGQRRAVVAAMLVSLFAFFMLLKAHKQWLFTKYAIPFLLIFSIYCIAYWNHPNVKGSGPVNLIKSGFVTPNKKTDPGDYYSNLYRKYEDYDLASTVRKHPLLGIGFGRKYYQPYPLVKITFPLRDYIPHNEIIWVLVKTGAIGFWFFWFFFFSVGLNATNLSVNIKDPYLKAVSALIVVAIISQMVVSFFDLQLTYYRNMIFLGTLMGLIPTLRRLDEMEDNKPLKLYTQPQFPVTFLTTYELPDAQKDDKK